MASDQFSAMVKEKTTRTKFIEHAIKFLRHYGFDGLDLGNFHLV
jgi:GH18 family chitinase